MSCAWDVKCLTCNVKAGMDVNHGVDIMRLLITNAKTIAAIDDLSTAAGKIGWFVELGSPGFSIPVQWFREHHAHRLAPVSEYGDLDGECSEKVQCPHCGSWMKCVLERDHDPRTLHSFKK